MDACPAPPPAAFGRDRTIAGRAVLVADCKGDPLGPFPSLRCEGLPYNRWLAAQVLDPVLGRWSDDDRGARAPAAAVARDLAWACGCGRRAFQEVLPAAVPLGDAAILAAMGVTANLERTLALLGEAVLDDRPFPRPRLPLRVSFLLCGLVEYPPGSPFFPARVRPPIHAARLHTRRRDPRCLGNALWCSERDINRGCEEALVELRQAIRRLGWLGPADFRPLHAPARIT
jgi:hypothetical protein